jgi:hypothetical protein
MLARTQLPPARPERSNEIVSCGIRTIRRSTRPLDRYCCAQHSQLPCAALDRANAMTLARAMRATIARAMRSNESNRDLRSIMRVRDCTSMRSSIRRPKRLRRSRPRRVALILPSRVFAERAVPPFERSFDSIIKFFYLDTAGMFRMTSWARYFNHGVGSSRPRWR